MTTWCERNWHDGACCPGGIRQWHEQRDLLPPDPVWSADACDHDDVETRTDDDLRITYVCRMCGAVL
jgi:hypothetical protein